VDQEKRVLAAFALSFLILLLWRIYFVKEPPPPPSAKSSATAQGRGTAEKRPPAVVTPPPAVNLPVVVGQKAEDVVVESNLYKVTFSTRGAVAQNWVLKNYLDAKATPLDVINNEACGKLGFPMSLRLAESELSNMLNSALFVATPAGATLTPPAKLEFTYSDGTVKAHKVLSFGTGYGVHVEISVERGGRFLPVEVEWPGGFGDHTVAPADIDRYEQGFYGSVSDLTRVTRRKLSSERMVPPPLALVGVEDHYFAEAALPDSPDEGFRLGRETWTPADWTGKDSDKPTAITARLGETQPKPLSFRLFVGPKNLDVLRAEKPPLDSLVDFGWFSFVAKPLFLGLRYIYEHWVHNYGWAIVVLTLLINFALFPLRLKGIRSAQEMQRISPLMKSIQDKYKHLKFNDPRKARMNEEMMKLYKEHNVNPLGGCLPVALQMPFLYGFYQVLQLPIELRHAPWIFWIKDLSAPDTFHPYGIPLAILPTVMIVSFYFSTKMNPTPNVDPAQQRMMMIMPVVFGIMFYKLASGLVLYFLTANLVQIAQQLLLNKFMPAPQPLSAPSPSEGKKSGPR